MPSGDYSFAEMLRLAIENRLSDVHVALPGKVISYDATKQTANIQPMVQRAVATEEESYVGEEMPIIPSVPILFLRGGGFFVSVPVAEGDTVLLVFSERDPSEWYRTGNNVAPGDKRLHSLAHAVAIPGLFPSFLALSGVGSNLVFGKDTGIRVTVTSSQMQVGGSTDSAALASAVDALATAFNTHTHTADNTPTAPGYTGGTSASTKLKVGG